MYMETLFNKEYLKKHNFSITGTDGRVIAVRRFIGGTITFGMCTSYERNGYKDLDFCEIHMDTDIFENWDREDGSYFKGYLNNIDQVLLLIRGMGYEGPDIFRMGPKEIKEYEVELDEYRSTKCILAILKEFLRNYHYKVGLDHLIEIYWDSLDLYYSEITKTHLVVINTNTTIEVLKSCGYCKSEKDLNNLYEIFEENQTILDKYKEKKEDWMKREFEDHSLIMVFDTKISKDYLKSWKHLDVIKEKREA